jgi:hypothetical protein
LVCKFIKYRNKIKRGIVPFSDMDRLFERLDRSLRSVHWDQYVFILNHSNSLLWNNQPENAFLTLILLYLRKKQKISGASVDKFTNQKRARVAGSFWLFCYSDEYSIGV